MRTAPLIEVRLELEYFSPDRGQMCACTLLPCWRSDVRMRPAPLIEVRLELEYCSLDRGQIGA
jgi:hypothetical protein